MYFRNLIIINTYVKLYCVLVEDDLSGSSTYLISYQEMYLYVAILWIF